MLKGGIEAYREAGYPLESSQRIDLVSNSSIMYSIDDCVYGTHEYSYTTAVLSTVIMPC